MLAQLGQLAVVGHKFITAPQASVQGFCDIIKLGTFCRTVVWPIFPPILMYQYIRAKEENYYAAEVLCYKPGSTDCKAFYDASLAFG